MQFFIKLWSLVLVIVLSTTSKPCFAESGNFSFVSFDSGSCNNGSSLICWGSVAAADGILLLTPENETRRPQDNVNRIGRVLFRSPVVAWPATFTTTFTVRILTNFSNSGDGMAFVIAQDAGPSPPESYGSFIGILDPSTEGALHQLAIELDTYKNEREVDANHVAIVTQSIEKPVAAKSLNSTGVYLKTGKEITFQIHYDGWTKMLQISVAYAGYPLVNFLNHKIIMQKTVPKSAYVGFTGSTAFIPETHQLLSWNFTTYILPEESLSQDLDEEKKTRLAVVILIPVLGMFLLATLPIYLKVQRRRIERKERKDDIEMLTRNAANAPKHYTYRQLSKATGKFSKDNLLGTGGFGSVYKGILSDPSSTIAVKKINATSKQGEREYLAEICTIGRLRHKNLVQLQGWCHEREQLLLVYEYMPNGSLDRYIGKNKLDWQTRYKILSGLASVLVYLHEECGNPVVHRDVKPNNVMLDSDFNAHLGDFGLARLLQNEDFVNTMVAGTPGYLAPEVSYTGRATPESDVYSFGMVVLEVVCGRRSKGIMEENSLVEYVWCSYEKGEILTCADKLLEEKFDEEQLRRTLIVGLACLHPDRNCRPKMRKVVQILMNSDEPLIKLPESRPVAVCLSFHSSTTSVTITDDYASTNARAGASTSMESFIEDDTIKVNACSNQFESSQRSESELAK